MNIHFSSKTDLWATPQYVFDYYNATYNFTTDLAANADNAKCARYFTSSQDSLKQTWAGSCWMNPPYGRQLINWIQKAYESAQEGATVVSLPPARTDTKWFQDYAVKGRIEFIRGRLKFGNGLHSAPFPSMTVIFLNGIKPEMKTISISRR